MSNMSDKLSASVRKAKAQGAEDIGVQASPAAEPKKAAGRARKQHSAASRPRAGAGTAAAPRKPATRKPATTAPPESSHDELFPTRVWPD